MILNVIPRINKVDYTGGESCLDLSAIKYTIDEKYGDSKRGKIPKMERSFASAECRMRSAELMKKTSYIGFL